VQVQLLVARIEREQGHLDILVNDVWGADFLIEWNGPVWEDSREDGLRMLRLRYRPHLITSHFALPLLIKDRADWSSR
jgi:NAD(P)-dependent dehydrogenase (short-subunit alcohol dehydrogenase family)